MAATTETAATFTQGEMVIYNSDDCGTPRKVVQVRKQTARVQLEDSRWFVDATHLTRVADVTPAQEAKFVKARATLRKTLAAREKAEQAASDYAALQRTTFAAQLAAEPEILSGPTFEPEYDHWTDARAVCDGFVGFVLRYWMVAGSGLDTVVMQREEKVGVEVVRRDSNYSLASAKTLYQWGVSFGGTTYDQLRARLIAESIQYALTTVIPTLGDARPSYGPELWP